MNTLYNKSNNKKHKILFMLLMLAMSPALLLAQTMTEKPTMGFSGAYDIRMISAPIMHPVWLKSGSSNSNMDILQEITTDEQLQFGRLTTQNNDLGGFPNAPAGAPAGAAKMGVAYADCDEDMNTFQSSAAYLDFGSEMECTTVQAAYLYWVVCTGNTTTYKPYPGKLTSRSHNGGATGNSSTAHTIKFKTPLDVNYHTITADRSGGTLPNNVYFKDVTSLVQNKGGGMYWVADVGSSSDLGDGGVAAWSLVVIFSPPNCPNRVIKFWEANSEMKATGGWDMNLDFAPGEVPATGNSVSYMGICALDGEGFAFDLMVDRQMTYADVEQNNYIGFKSSLGTGGSGGTTGTPAKINVFTDNQPYDAGPTVPFPALDGVFCSRISSWDKDAGTNGNDLSRRPENRYTAGYDAHHIKLPAGAMGASARSATMSLVCERAGTKKSGDNPCGGGYTPFMAYMAIETLQPNLKMTKKAVSPTVETGKDITYRITTKNIGGLKSNAGALIVDTLDLPVDMIDESSIKFFDKDMNPITTVTYQIENKGADNNETLKFTLPEIAAGVNEVATDSITIEFSVRVKEKDRMDIWSVGCRREIRNKATIFYKTTEGADLIAGSNATAGCGGFGEPEIVRVDDQDLEDLIEETHNMTINLSDEVNSATPPLIVARVRQLLETQLTKLGRPTSEAALYTVFTDNMVAVLPTDVMTNAVAIQNYIAWRNVGSDCEEEFYFTIEVAKVPKITVVSTAPTTCVGETNGTATIRATEGDPVYVMKVVDAVDDNTVFFQSNATNVNSYDFSVDGLKAGDYKIILTDISNTPVTQNFSIADPDPFTTTITSACDGSGGVEFMANPTGRPLAGLQYAWKEFDGTNWIPAAGTNNAQNYTPVIGSGKKYSVTVCDGSCVVTELIDLPLLSVPDEEVSISSTPPHTTIFAAATTIDGIATTDSYSYNWEVSNDNGATWTAISSATISGVDGTYSDYTTANLTVDDITLAMNDYRYRLTISLPEGCVGMTQALLTVTEGPRVIATKTDASCANVADGTLQIQLADGEDLVNYTVNIYKGKYDKTSPPTGETPVATGTYTTPESPKTIAILNDLAGSETGEDYTVEIIPDNSSYSTTYYSNNQSKILAPASIIVNVVAPPAVCEGTPAVLNGMVTGGPASGSTSYEWQMSLDDINYSNVGAADQLSYPLSANSYFRLIGKVGTCADTSTVSYIENSPTPQVEIYLKVDSGCFRYNLDTLKIREKNGASYNKLTLHRTEPTSAIDNSTLIPEKDYVITRNMVVYARMSNSDLCYTVDNGAVYIKAMDECYPITMPVFFSPDGDGINDYFRIEGLEHYLGYEITIYDRYGKEVFRGGAGKIDYPSSLGWDGKYLGNDLPSGDYWYQMTFTEIPTKVGYFALKRKKE